VKLKRLSLAGFKTFADKTEIELGDGVTAVVGPNGCGKSNIADALLWALGEQNPRLLRGSESRDFIFSGSERRKPLGMAEVRLTIDNSDGTMPIEFAEVEISRRIYRSGESRYAINGVQCRLKDIVDLFLDTGMGRGAYSFISQSEVDAVLSAKPEDRRELFEEAAGVQKYRTRKREAVRKLEMAEANLTRINDIVHELERQRAPLKAQAEIAERYLAMTERLRTIEVNVLISEIQRADYELYAARQERDRDIAAVRGYDDRLAALERRSLSLRDLISEAETELEAARVSRQGALTHLERTDHQLQLTLERARNAEATAASLEADIRDMLTREVAAEAAINKDRAALDKITSRLSALSAQLDSARAVLDAALRAAREAELEGRDRAQEQRRLLAERSARETALAACSARISEAERRLEEIGAETARQAAAIAAAEEAAARALDRVAGLEAEAAAAGSEQQARDADVRKAEDARSRAASAADAMHRRLVEVTARLHTLREIHASGEGMFQGVRSVLEASRSGHVVTNAAKQSPQLHGTFQAVVDVLSVPERYRTAIEVALGSDAQSLICRTDREARDAIAWLKAGKKGRATFLPLNLLQPPPALESSVAARVPGAVGVAANLVDCPAELSPAIRLLLGRVVVFESVEAATAAMGQVNGWRRFVTLQGETLTPGGALTGGVIPGKAGRLVSRKGDIDDLAREADELRRQTEALDQTLAEADQALAAARARAAEAADRAGQLGASLLECRRDAASASSVLTTERRRGDDLAAEAARIQQTLSQLTAEQQEWESALAACDLKDTEADGDLAEAQRKTEEAAQACDRARADVAALDVEVGRLTEQARAARAALERSERTLGDLRASRAARQAQREAVSGTIAEAERARGDLETEAAEARRRFEQTEEVFAHWRDERQQRLELSFAVSAEIKEATDQRRKTMENLHEEELRIARLEVRLAQHAQRLTEDYAMTLEEALAAPDPGEMDRDTLNEIVRLRRELRAMGAVNTGAAEEYRRLTERYEFLETQRADLEAASTSLRETIAEIDQSTRTVFMETFQAVSESFSQLFSRLFGGGKTQLVLTTPEDLLETGIEIIVQPPGKRASSLSLLSGGERALTAVALLFSFLMVRPSPFVVLDEVDAPLDGPNVEKFAELVTDFARDTQFLIMTHNPTTMECAPRWYGVTMQEPGVSRVLSYAPERRTCDATSGSTQLKN
jgi:chromosome segregation protein